MVFDDKLWYLTILLYVVFIHTAAVYDEYHSAAVPVWRYSSPRFEGLSVPIARLNLLLRTAPRSKYVDVEDDSTHQEIEATTNATCVYRTYE